MFWNLFSVLIVAAQAGGRSLRRGRERPSTLLPPLRLYVRPPHVGRLDQDRGETGQDAIPTGVRPSVGACPARD